MPAATVPCAAAAPLFAPQGSAYLWACVLAQGIAKKKNTKTIGIEAFAKQHLSKAALQNKTDVLFAVYSSYAERGGRPYWLLNVLGAAYKKSRSIVCVMVPQLELHSPPLGDHSVHQTPRRPMRPRLTRRALASQIRYKLKAKKKQDGITLSKGTWVVKAQWYESTSDDQLRRSYELTQEEVFVPVDVLVQEVGLEFERAGLHQRILKPASHAAQHVERPPPEGPSLAPQRA